MKESCYRPTKLLHDWEKVFNSFFDLEPDTFWDIGSSSQTAIDVRETKEFYFIDVDLPGVDEEKLKVDVKDSILEISYKDQADKKEDKEYIIQERKCRSFYRRIALPKNIKHEEIKARLRQGVLTINIPKSEEAIPRNINVKVEN